MILLGWTTNYGGPAVSYSNVEENQINGTVGFELQENEYKVVLDAEVDEGIPVRVDFMIYENKKCIFQAKYTIRKMSYLALQVILNCDSEFLVKEELIKRFSA